MIDYDLLFPPEEINPPIAYQPKTYPLMLE